MELRHDACHNESRDRHHRRWKPFSDEVIYSPLGAYIPGRGSGRLYDIKSNSQGSIIRSFTKGPRRIIKM
jgi:hypothetical protein